MKTFYSIVLDTRLPLAEMDDNAIHLLVADVSPLMEDETLLQEAVGQLSPQRRSKAEACGNPRSRALTTGVTLLLDRLLRPLGLREKKLYYEEGPHGKPTLQAGTTPFDIAFNLSHSGHLAAAALCVGASPYSLGIDIQRQTRYRPELVRRVYNDADRALLATCTTETERERCFAQLWCRAEAYAKATGEGLRWPFATPPADARFTDFLVGDDYFGCLCTLRLETDPHEP